MRGGKNESLQKNILSGIKLIKKTTFNFGFDFLRILHILLYIVFFACLKCFSENLETYIRLKGLNRNVLDSVFFQGWEFAHQFSELIARFLRKNEQMSD